MEEHSVNLLRECDSGCKMAAESLEQIRDMVSDQELWKDITESYEKHQELDAKIKKTLSAMEEEGKEPGKWHLPGHGCPQKCVCWQRAATKKPPVLSLTAVIWGSRPYAVIKISILVRQRLSWRSPMSSPGWRKISEII